MGSVVSIVGLLGIRLGFWFNYRLGHWDCVRVCVCCVFFLFWGDPLYVLFVLRVTEILVELRKSQCDY